MSDIRSALEAAFNEAEESKTVVDESPQAANQPSQETVEPSETESKPARARDESGKFVPKETTQQAVEPVQQAAPTRNPFSSWKPDAQSALLKAERGETLTPDELKLIRVEAERRESDFHKGVSEFKSHSERAKAYDAVIAPYQGYLQRLGVDAPTAINALMRADMTLRTSDPATKAQYFAQLAREYGIDLGQVQEPPQVDPQTQYLMNQLNELRQSQQMWQNQLQQQEQMRAQQELSQFATADRPHFDAVRNDMADLLETGKAKSMQEAYEMAVWMRPDIRTTLIEQQRAEAQRKAIESAQAQRAKTAAVSVRGSSPIAGTGQNANKGASLREIIEASFAENS